MKRFVKLGKNYSGDRGGVKAFFLVLHQLKKHVLLVKTKKKSRCLMNSSTDIDWISILLKTCALHKYTEIFCHHQTERASFL